ncbi:MAG: tyrosine-type recombinase/integrase [Betaproteobacteria bacterium]|nr:tyrosine-type recombinase/integrase [Betaproteobacteria bacterium]
MDTFEHEAEQTLYTRLVEFIALQVNPVTDSPAIAVRNESPVAKRTLIRVNEDVVRRLERTILRGALQELQAAATDMRALGEAAFDALMEKLQKARKSIRHQTRRGVETPALALLERMQVRHSFTLVPESTSDSRALVDGINSARGKVVDKWMAVLAGDTTVAEELPRAEDGLQLESLTGHSPLDCLEQWARSKGGQRNLRTYNKFRGIAEDLAGLLDGRCVEALTADDVLMYADYLRAKGNGLGTIHGKLGICATLLSGCEISRTARRAFFDVRPPKSRVKQHSAPRTPFDTEQLGNLLQAVFEDTSLPPDDRVIVALQALSGARLEEICSLRGSQLSWNGKYWCIDFVEADVPTKETKPASMRPKTETLKCKDSVRAIPVVVNAVCGLHERLVALKKMAGKGMLFSHLKANVYGQYGGAVGKRLNKRIDDAVSKDRRLVLESLRNTAAPAMRHAGIDADERRLFLGHAPSDLHAKHYDRPTTEDLVRAARAVSEMVAKALAGRHYPALDEQYRARPHLKARHTGISTAHAKSTRPGARSATLDERQSNRRFDAAQGSHQNVNGHGAVVSSDVAVTMPGESIVDILGNPSRSTQGLECVPEGVKDQSSVLDATPRVLAQVATPPLAPVAGALGKAVGNQLREEPLVPSRTPDVEIAPQPNAFQLGMDGNDANRGIVLDPDGQAIRADVQQQAMHWVQFDVADPQLAELLETAAGEQTQRRKPRTSLPSTGSRPKPLGKDWRGEDLLQFLGGEGAPPGRLSFLPRNTQSPNRIDLLKAGVDRGLKNGAEMSQFFGHGLGMKRCFKQRIPIGGDDSTVNPRHGSIDKPVEVLCRCLKRNDSPQGAVGV